MSIFFVEGRASFADVEDEMVGNDDRRAGESPAGFSGVKFFHEVFLPEDFSSCGVEAKNVTPLAEGVNAIGIDGGSRAGAAFVVNRIEGRRVGVFPKLLAGFGVEGI